MADCAATPKSQQEFEDFLDDPAARLQEVLDNLDRASDRSNASQWVIEAEILPFRGEQASKLAKLLKRYLEEVRDSPDEEDLIAAGCAIRKLIGMESVDSALSFSAELLDRAGQNCLPIELELEVVQMIVRKLTANPAGSAQGNGRLAHVLVRVIQDRAKAAFDSEDLKPAVVVLNAILGLAMLEPWGPSRLEEILDGLPLRETKARWFSQLLARRATRLLEDLHARFPGETKATWEWSLTWLREQAERCPVPRTGAS